MSQLRVWSRKSQVRIRQELPVPDESVADPGRRLRAYSELVVYHRIQAFGVGPVGDVHAG